MFCAITYVWCEKDQISARACSPSKAFACVSAVSHKDTSNLRGQESRKEVQTAAFIKGQQEL